MMREGVAAAGVMVLAGAGYAGGCDLAFSYANFNSPQPTLTLVGSAALNAGGLRLTTATEGQSGAAWRSAPVAAGQGFRTTFRCRMPDAGVNFGPGDGMALVLQPEGNTVLGGGGSDMGYGGTIGGGVAIELDEFGFGDEFPTDHVSIQVAQFDDVEQWWALQSLDDWSQAHAVLNTDINEVGLTMRVEVTGVDTGSTMDIAVIVRDDADGRVLGAARANGVAKAAFLDGGGCAYIGFTAGTGAAYNEHRVESWSYEGFTSSCQGQVQFHSFAPQTVTLAVGDTTTVEFDWTMSAGPWLYSWGRETGTPGDFADLDDGNGFFGTHSNQLTIGPATVDMAGNYSYGIGNGCMGASSGFTLVVQAPCPADLGVQGGTAGQDGLLNNNDFVVFITYFFNQNPLADHGVQGGTPGHDGLFDNNDFVVFITEFFAGCG